MHIVYLGLGSNQGDSKYHLMRARHAIHQEIGTVCKASSLYRTEAWGKTDQAPFINQVIAVNTPLLPEDILKIILKIENQLGRIRSEKWGPRIIDIDILFFDNEIIESKNLIVPHPLLGERNFVLKPMLEINKFHIHPKLNMTIEEISNDCSDISAIELIENR